VKQSGAIVKLLEGLCTIAIYRNSSAAKSALNNINTKFKNLSNKNSPYLRVWKVNSAASATLKNGNKEDLVTSSTKYNTTAMENGRISNSSSSTGSTSTTHS